MKRTSSSLLKASAACLQMQHPHILTKQHGAGLVRHRDVNDPMANNFKPEFAPEQLTHTKVHEGMGTSAQDPYNRTLPNQPLKAQVSTVVTAPENTVPTPNELSNLGSKWGTLSYWMGGAHPRLRYYLRSKIIETPPAPGSTVQQLEAFSKKELTEIAATSGQPLLVEQWSGIVSRFNNLPLDAHDQNQYIARLTSIKKEAVKLFGQSDADQLSRVEAMLGLLAQQAIGKRNTKLSEIISMLAEEQQYFASGDAVWAQLFDSFAEHRSELIRGNDAVAALWERAESTSTLPEVKAPVAVFLASIALELGAAKRATSAPVANLMNGLKRNGVADGSDPVLGEMEFEKAVDILRPKLQELFSAPTQALAGMLYEMKLYGAHSAVQLMVAQENTGGAAREAPSKAIATYFKDSQKAAALLTRLMGQETGSLARRVLGLDDHMRNAQELLNFLQWQTNHVTIMNQVCSEPKLLDVVHNFFKSKGAGIQGKKSLEAAETEKAMAAIDDLRGINEQISKSTEQRIAQCVNFLTNKKEVIPAALHILKVHNISTDDFAAAKGAAKQRRNLQVPTAKPLLHDVLLEVAQAHPHWALDGVIPTDISQLTDGASFVAIQAAFRIYLRLSVPPQAGEAMLKSRYRRRIGPVRAEKGCFNVPVEIGQAESYDNLLYKKYDHQGWYQRMRDVYLRNVSIRCDLKDLRRLDANGQPYIDLQTERRLRILADERIGSGIVKLDSDRFEDSSDNLEYGTGKFMELMAEGKKAQLGKEYWPSVEVKVRNPSGQSKLHYSTVDWERLEERSEALYTKYRDLKKTTLFVKPQDTWLKVQGATRTSTAAVSDDDGYSVDEVMSAMGSTDGQ